MTSSPGGRSWPSCPARGRPWRAPTRASSPRGSPQRCSPSPTTTRCSREGSSPASPGSGCSAPSSSSPWPARAVSGAAVQTDSLQLRLELTQARVGQLVRESVLRIARLELGRRVGAAGPVDAAPLDTTPAPELPLTLADAITQAATQGPQYRVAQANERAAAAAFRGQLGTYLPRATLTFNALAFDTLFYPSAFKRTTFTLGVSFPIWDNAQREIALSQARVNRDVARAIRQDMDRAVQRDVTAAYDGYTTARASTELAGEGRRVARENFRVQQTRYRTGATTILDLLKAQSDFDDAEAALVQARYATRLALAGLETILGRRLYPEPEQR